MIDYARLDRSLNFYEDRGFKRIELPWTVTRATSEITKPEGKQEWEIIGKNKVLVASGEQGFLYLYLKGFLPKGRFQGITPCFREEPFDQTHTKYFIKNELIITDEVNNKSLVDIINVAKEFYESELGTSVDLVKTEQGFDLEVNGIELGSYGIRSCEYLDWIYGTGVAEPRFSTIKSIIDKSAIEIKN